MSLNTLLCQGPHNPSSCAMFMLNPHWGRAATDKNSLVSMHARLLQSCPTLCDPMAVASLLEGFSRQEYWSILANTGCHTLLEHYISCCSSCQLPWVPGAARTPMIQVASPPPHLAFTGEDPNPPGQPQDHTPVDDPHARVEIKPQLKLRGRVAKEEDPKPSHQLYKWPIKSTRSTRQILSLCNI